MSFVGGAGRREQMSMNPSVRNFPRLHTPELDFRAVSRASMSFDELLTGTREVEWPSKLQAETSPCQRTQRNYFLWSRLVTYPGGIRVLISCLPYFALVLNCNTWWGLFSGTITSVLCHRR